VGRIDIIGNKVFFLYIISLASFCYGQESIDISVRDTYGRKITQVVVGKPFTLHVLLQDIDGSNARVSIERSPGIALHRTSVQMRSINGRASTTYIYTGRADQRGMYVLGPVTVDDGKQRYASNQMRIDVVDELADTRNKHNEYVTLQLIPSKLSAYVGETLSLSLRFYYPHDGIRAERLIQPSIPHSIQSAITGPFAGTETIDAVIYDYSEWRWDVVFQKEGVYAIPAYTMEYVDHSQQQAGHFGFFSSFFNDFKVKQVSSPGVSIRVQEAPAHPQASKFVGVAHTYTASLDHGATVIGQPVVLTLELASDHHNASLVSPMLQELPRSLKYYESKVENSDDGHVTRTRFEYIVQPLEVGEWEIPAQSYTYFDTRTETYETIYTAPLYLTVEPGAQGAGHFHESSNNQQQSDNYNASDDVLRPLHEVGPWTKEQDRALIPWWLFWLLMTIPLWHSIGMYSFRRWMQHRDDTVMDRRARYAFTYARTSLKRVSNTGSAQDLVMIFKQLCADVWRMPVHEITESLIQTRLKTSLSPEAYTEWNQFWMQLLEGAYTKRLYDDVSFKQLCNNVAVWLDRLSTWL